MMTTFGLEFMNMIINPWLSDAHSPCIQPLQPLQSIYNYIRVVEDDDIMDGWKFDLSTITTF